MLKKVHWTALIFSLTLISCPKLPSLQQAQRLAVEGNSLAALSICDKHLLNNPQNQIALRFRGAIHMVAGNLDLAEVDLNYAIKLDPNDRISLFNRGKLFHNLNKDTLAYADFKSALKLGYDISELRMELAETCIRQREFKEALTHSKAGMLLEPDIFIHHANLGMALQLLGQNEEALASYDKAIQLDPDDSTIYVLRGQLLCKEERRSEARRDFATARDMEAKWILDKSCYCPNDTTK